MKKVKIKEDISVCEDVVPEMLRFQGKVVTVTEEWKNVFFIAEDKQNWSWYYNTIDEIIE